MSARDNHCTDVVQQSALGAIAAQRAIDEVRGNDSDVPIAWHAVCVLASKHGWRSPAAAAFITEMAKRAAQ